MGPAAFVVISKHVSVFFWSACDLKNDGFLERKVKAVWRIYIFVTWPKHKKQNVRALEASRGLSLDSVRRPSKFLP